MRHGGTFQQQVTLRAAVADAPRAVDDLITLAGSSLEAGPAGIRVTLDEPPAEGLLVEDGVRLCPQPQDTSRSPPSSRKPLRSPPASGVAHRPGTWPQPAASPPWSPSAPKRSSRP
ncbi:hypothetical protein [Streptomyces sp. NPDC014623]|uniref:hypothetical protein n=1 Tax=Streptomyces sp. NPDC014623 TaxID=3364875 RepID=UPI0036FC22AF